MLLPLPEPALFQLDLLGEPLSQHLLLFLELWVVDLFDFRLSEFTSLHLRKSVRLVVGFFGRGDQVEHVRSNEKRSEFLEITVILVLDWHYQLLFRVLFMWMKKADLRQRPIGTLGP